MIENLKSGLIVLLAIACWYLNYSFDSYKENINEQVQRNISEKARVEAEQRERYLKSQRDLMVSGSRLDSALKRVRELEIMSRGTSVQVAECGSDAVPGTSENPTRTNEETSIANGIRSTAFYAAAMNDVLQCSRLIDFVSEKNLKHTLIKQSDE